MLHPVYDDGKLDCMGYNEINKQHDRLKQARFRRALKRKCIEYKGGKCERCGYDKNLTAMCFHHAAGNKDFAISRSTRCRWEAVRVELDKCMLLCMNCHTEIHANEYDRKMESLERALNMSRRECDGKKECRSCGTRFSVTISGNRCPLCADHVKMLMNSRSEKKTKIASMLLTLTVNEVADELKMRTCNLIRFCNRHGIPYEIKPWKPSTKIEWPSDEELANLVANYPMIRLSKQLGVSNTAIRRRCQSRGIELPAKGYWARKEWLEKINL